MDRFLVSGSKKLALGFGEFSSFGGGDDEIRVSSSWFLPCLQAKDYVESDLHLNHGNSNGLIVQVGDGTSSVRTEKESSQASATLVKREWVQEEDRILVKLVKEYGVKKWALLAQKLDGRTPKQCRERWQNHLRPDIKKDLWSEEEETILIEVHKKLGNRWSEIARMIPGRTESAVKNHWNATKRRKAEKNIHKKYKESNVMPPITKPSSLLQDYIKSNNLYHNCVTTSPSSTKITHDQDNSMTPNKALISNIEFEVHPPHKTEFHGHNKYSLMSPLIGEDFDEELFSMLTHHLQPPPPPLQNLVSMAELSNDQYKNPSNLQDYQSSSCSTFSLNKENGRDFGSAMEMDFMGMDGGGQVRKGMDLIDDLFFSSLGSYDV